MSQNCNLAWVSEWKFQAPSRLCEWKIWRKIWHDLDLYRKTVVISVNFGFGDSSITVTNAKSSAESEKFTLKIRSESGNFFTNGCHFPPKSTKFGNTVIICFGPAAFLKIRGCLASALPGIWLCNSTKTSDSEMSISVRAKLSQCDLCLQLLKNQCRHSQCFLSAGLAPVCDPVNVDFRSSSAHHHRPPGPSVSSSSVAGAMSLSSDLLPGSPGHQWLALCYVRPESSQASRYRFQGQDRASGGNTDGRGETGGTAARRRRGTESGGSSRGRAQGAATETATAEKEQERNSVRDPSGVFYGICSAESPDARDPKRGKTFASVTGELFVEEQHETGVSTRRKPICTVAVKIDST